MRTAVIQQQYGDAGVAETMRQMATLAKAGAKWINLRQFALKLVKGLPGKDFLGELAKVFEWVRNNIRYVRDIYQVETLHTVQRILKNGQGDCDDMAILIGAMMLALGAKIRFVAAAFTHTMNRLAHVWPEILVNGRWIAADATEPYPLGWTPPGKTKTMVLEV